MTALRSDKYTKATMRFTGDPLDIVARLASAGLHEDYLVYENRNEWCFASGIAREVVLDSHGIRVRGHGAGHHLPWDDAPLPAVQRALADAELPDWRAYGWAAFELAYAMAGDLDAIDPEQTLLRLVIPHTEIRLGARVAGVRSLDERTAETVCALVADERPTMASRCKPVNVRAHGAERYRQAVADAVHEINDHRLHKVILSRTVPLAQPIDLVASYVEGRRANTPARSFLLRSDGLEAAGFSPEIVVSVDATGKVISQPLAGTRALTADPARDAALRAELISDPKEIYEHAISVKTALDELRPVCRPETLAVEEFMEVCRRGTVQHLASRVGGQLAAGRNAWDAFAAVFPAVTASGVPKRAAYRSIRAHEQAPRGLYSGAVMTVDRSGALDAALVLRAVYRQGSRTWLQGGAGIVGQSRPERELAETAEKLDSVARHLVRATPGRHRLDARRA